MDTLSARIDRLKLNTNRTKNELAPISRLSDDVLCAIFLGLQSPSPVMHSNSWTKGIYIHEDPLHHRDCMSWVATVTHVCSWWRTVAINSPFLWGRICLNGFKRPWVDEFIARSTTTPLSIYYHGAYRFHSPTPPADRLISMLRLGRSKALLLHDLQRETAHAALDYLTSPAPNLETVYITSVPCILPPKIFNDSAPQLRFLRLEGPYLSWSSSLFQHLRTLMIHLRHSDGGQGSTFKYPSFTLDEVLGALQQCSDTLEVLVLDFPTPLALTETTKFKPAVQTKTLQFPTLRVLSLDLSAPVAAQLLRHIEILPATTIQVFCEQVIPHQEEAFCEVLAYLAHHVSRPGSNICACRSETRCHSYVTLIADRLGEDSPYLDITHCDSSPTDDEDDTSEEEATSDAGDDHSAENEAPIGDSDDKNGSSHSEVTPFDWSADPAYLDIRFKGSPSNLRPSQRTAIFMVTTVLSLPVESLSILSQLNMSEQDWSHPWHFQTLQQTTVCDLWIGAEDAEGLLKTWRADIKAGRPADYLPRLRWLYILGFSSIGNYQEVLDALKDVLQHVAATRGPLPTLRLGLLPKGTLIDEKEVALVQSWVGEMNLDWDD